MNARFARWALLLYPLAHRRRYGAEMKALIEDAGAGPSAVVDLVRGAARAHLHPEPQLAAELEPGDRLRLGLGAVLFCGVFFALAGLGFYKTTEGAAFGAAGEADGILAAARFAVEALAALSAIAVVVGAAPLVAFALREARDRPAVRGATALASGCLVVFGLATAALVAFANSVADPSDAASAAALAIWTAIAAACGVGSALAGRHGIFAVDPPASLLRLARVCAVVVALGMAGIAVAAGVYLVALLGGDPRLAASGNGPLELTSVAASLAIQLAVMALAAIPAAFAVRRATGPAA